jgi:pantetheine-phosphate adenylyltransferase
MKAIITTSANPFHYGHLDLYDRAADIFGEGLVKVVIGKNTGKNVDFEQISYHLVPYKIKYEIIQGSTLADYCKDVGIKYMARGIRSSADTEAELKLAFINREINKDLDVVFLPAKHIFDNISSSGIAELLKYRKFDVAEKYMNVDAMYRFYNKKPKFVVFFGKSCIGKSYYLNKTFKDVANSDKILWEVFERIYGKEKMEAVRRESRDLIFGGRNIADLMKIYSNEIFWNEFFDFIERNIAADDMSWYIDLKDKNEVYAVDFASIGVYWDTVPAELRGKIYLVKLENSDENRQKYIISKNFEEKITYLDKNYAEPHYFDMIKNINDHENSVSEHLH